MTEKKPKISPAEVLYVANLARLSLDPAEVETFTKQVGDILAYVEKLENADTSDVPAATHVLPICNAMREDEVAPSLDRESALENAPRRDDANFIVPRVI